MFDKLYNMEKIVDNCYSISYKSNNQVVGDIYKEVDGFYVFWPRYIGGGFIDSRYMRALADKLDEMNAAWTKELNAFVETQVVRD